MANAKNMQQLQKLLDIAIPKALDKSGNEFTDIIKDFLNETLYSYDSTYDRTRDYLNSLISTKVEKVGNSYIKTIYFDTDKIHPIPSSQRTDGWDAHMTNGVDVSDEFPYMMEYGVEGNANPYINKGVHSMEYAKSKEDYLVEKFKKYLRKEGWNVKE